MMLNKLLNLSGLVYSNIINASSVTENEVDIQSSMVEDNDNRK